MFQTTHTQTIKQVVFYWWLTDVLTLWYCSVTIVVVITAVFAQGGVIGIFINWKCNLDIDASHCKPTYSFRRLDLRKDQANSGYYYRWLSWFGILSCVCLFVSGSLSPPLHLCFPCNCPGLPNITERVGWSLGHLSRPTAFVWMS